ncbi:MAG: hypothetical protein JXM72_13000 [Deltaproteobacteria bacterium]|nr:hypothetical protein [Deltaproteobacteria bacterium]
MERDSIMHEELKRIQEEHAVQALTSLFMHCRNRFLRSAELVEINGSAIDQLRKFGFQTRVDLSPLIPAWQYVCKRYRDERYDPQMQLFCDNGTKLEQMWGQFVYHDLVPQLLRENEFVRNVLRALGGIPCTSPDKAAGAVYQYFLEMTLPAMQPSCTHEDIL